MKRKWPALTSDEDAERFVEEADLTEYDLSQMVPVSYEFEEKAAAQNRSPSLPRNPERGMCSDVHMLRNR